MQCIDAIIHNIDLFYYPCYILSVRTKIKSCRTFPILAFLCLPVLISCGINTKDWPRIDLKLDDASLKSIEIEHFERNNKTGVIDEKNVKRTNKPDSIKQNIENIESLPYKENFEEVPTSKDYIFKTIISIEGEDVFSKITLINYGVSNGFVSFKEREWHFLPGDFSGLYYDFIA